MIRQLQFALSTGPLPLAAGASGTINVLNTVSSAVGPSQQTVPPWRRPYLVREIRFVAAGIPGNGSDCQMFFQVKLQCGTFAMTNGFVPICLLGPQVQRLQSSSGIGGYLAATNSATAYYNARWVLPKPMYVQPGNGIQATFARFQDGQTTVAGTIEMVVVGEILPENAPAQKTSCIPFVSSYVNNNTASSASQASDLENPFSDRNLNMQRFMGHGFRLLGGTQLVAISNSVNNNGGNTSTLSTAPTIRITDSDRFPITPSSGLRFGELFDARSFSLEHRRVLPPKGWFQIQFSNAAQTFGTFTTSVFFVSAVGYREETLNS